MQKSPVRTIGPRVPLLGASNLVSYLIIYMGRLMSRFTPAQSLESSTKLFQAHSLFPSQVDIGWHAYPALRDRNRQEVLIPPA